MSCRPKSCRPKSCRLASFIAAAAGLAIAASAHAQLRVGQWNITAWETADVASRGSAFQTSIYGIAPNGLSFAPDILVVQEITEGSGNGSAAVTAFLNLLNTAPNSPADWAAAPYVFNQGDTGNAMFYRTTRVQWLSTTTLGCASACPGGVVDVGTGSSQSPRDNQRYRVRLVGYTGPDAEMYLYAGHFKAGNSGADQLRREPEGLRIRNDSNALGATTNALVCADFNVQESSQTFYQYLVAFNSALPLGDPRRIQAGQFFDPINLPGVWENSGTFRYVHTQEPSTQMDSRHDQILITSSLRDRQGLSYIPAIPSGNILLPWAAADWKDNNHSYRCWGNDGNNFQQPINANGNNQVGSSIAQALITTVAAGGHLPVYLDLQVPAKLGAPSGTIDLGTVAQNATVTVQIQITNAANVALWSKNGTGWGVDNLTYSFAFSPSSPFSMQGGLGPFERSATPAPAQATTHTIVLNTSTTGNKNATLTIASDDPDVPSRVINLTAIVGSGSPPPGNYDVNADGTANIEDLYRWYGTFTDVDQNGSVNTADAAFLRTFLRWFENPDMTFNRR